MKQQANPAKGAIYNTDPEIGKIQTKVPGWQWLSIFANFRYFKIYTIHVVSARSEELIN